MAITNCKAVLQSSITEKDIWFDFYFDSTCVESFRPYINNEGIPVENETVIQFKSGSTEVVNMSTMDVYHYTQAIPYSYN